MRASRDHVTSPYKQKGGIIRQAGFNPARRRARKNDRQWQITQGEQPYPLQQRDLPLPVRSLASREDYHLLSEWGVDRTGSACVKGRPRGEKTEACRGLEPCVMSKSAKADGQWQITSRVGATHCPNVICHCPSARCRRRRVMCNHFFVRGAFKQWGPHDLRAQEQRTLQPGGLEPCVTSKRQNGRDRWQQASSLERCLLPCPSIRCGDGSPLTHCSHLDVLLGDSCRG